jgi:hypothetical protein
MVFAINPAGEIVHTYKITSPDPVYEPAYLDGSKGKFTVVYGPDQDRNPGPKTPNIYRSYDVMTGELE